MSRHWTVRTPEGVEITYSLAGIGSRGGAVMVDHLLQGTLIIAFVLLAWALDYFSSGNGDGVLTNASGPWLPVIFGLLVFTCTWGYFVLFEWLANGQTPGKLMFGLRAVKEDGRPIDFFTSASRNLLRIVDFLPGFYGVGLSSLFFSPAYRRIGDYGAGTIVVKEYAPERPAKRRKRERNRTVTPAPSTTDLPTDAPDPPDLSQSLLTTRIEREEYDAARRFMQRRSDLAPDVVDDLARKIATPIMRRTGFVQDPAAPIDAEEFLRGVIDAYTRWQDLRNG